LLMSVEAIVPHQLEKIFKFGTFFSAHSVSILRAGGQIETAVAQR